MKTQRKILWLLPLLLGVNIQASTAAPAPEKVPLCDLQRTAKQGEQRSVQVGGIYITGFEGSILTDAACPDQSTWIEFDLKSAANKEQLRSMLDTAGKADVVFEGEFYGPGMPSPNLPEAVRKLYQPGLGSSCGIQDQVGCPRDPECEAGGQRPGHEITKNLSAPFIHSLTVDEWETTNTGGNGQFSDSSRLLRSSSRSVSTPRLQLPRTSR